VGVCDDRDFLYIHNLHVRRCLWRLWMCPRPPREQGCTGRAVGLSPKSCAAFGSCVVGPSSCSWGSGCTCVKTGAGLEHPMRLKCDASSISKHSLLQREGERRREGGREGGMEGERERGRERERKRQSPCHATRQAASAEEEGRASMRGMTAYDKTLATLLLVDRGLSTRGAHSLEAAPLSDLDGLPPTFPVVGCNDCRIMRLATGMYLNPKPT